jgi:hypothetical protein
MNLDHASVDVDLVASLIEQPRDEVHPYERSGLAVLAHEHDSPMAVDLCH